MDFHPFTTNHEACSKSHLVDTTDEFYAMATGLFAVPAGERPLGDRAGCPVKGSRQVRGQR
jgi:hypothetical protein